MRQPVRRALAPGEWARCHVTGIVVVRERVVRTGGGTTVVYHDTGGYMHTGRCLRRLGVGS